VQGFGGERLAGFSRSLLHQSLKLLKCFLPSLQPVNIEAYAHLCFVACGSVECFFGSGVDSQRYSAVLLTERDTGLDLWLVLFPPHVTLGVRPSVR